MSQSVSLMVRNSADTTFSLLRWIKHTVDPSVILSVAEHESLFTYSV